MAKKNAKHKFDIRIYADGDFGVFAAGSDKEYKAKSKEKFLKDISDKSVSENKSIANSFFNYYKTGSGWIVVGGRYIYVP